MPSEQEQGVELFVWIDGEPPHDEGVRIIVENDRGIHLVYWEEDGSNEWCWICPDGKHDDRPLRGNEIMRWARIPLGTPTPDAVNADKAVIHALRDAVGDEIGNKVEARERFGEEAIELIQAAGGSFAEVVWMAQKVFAKPVDPVALEVGQVNTALHRLAFAHDVDVATEAERDRAHILANAGAIRERHARKERFSDKALMPEAAVAWMYEKDGVASITQHRATWDWQSEGGWTETPLFTTPIPVEEPEKGAVGEIVTKLRAKGETVPERIWLHGFGSDGGDVTWSNEPDPSGEPEEAEWAVEYALAATNAGQVEAERIVRQRLMAIQERGNAIACSLAGQALTALSQAKEPGK